MRVQQIKQIRIGSTPELKLEPNLKVLWRSTAVVGRQDGVSQPQA